MSIFYAIVMSMEEDEAAIKKETLMFQSSRGEPSMSELPSELGSQGNGAPNIFDRVQEDGTENQSRNTEQEERRRANRVEGYFWLRDISNWLITLLSYLVLCIDYEGQSGQFEFVIDCVDVGMFLCSTITVVASVMLELRFREGLETATISDIVIMLVSLIGLAYEAAIAEDAYQFFSAETLAAELLRSFKSWRLFTLIVRHK